MHSLAERREKHSPLDEDQLGTLLEAFLLDKAFYELNYELNNRPDWLHIPLQGILELAKTPLQGSKP